MIIHAGRSLPNSNFSPRCPSWNRISRSLQVDLFYRQLPASKTPNSNCPQLPIHSISLISVVTSTDFDAPTINRPLHHSIHHHIMHTDTPSRVALDHRTYSTHVLQIDCSITGPNSACIPPCTITSHIAHAHTPVTGRTVSLCALMRSR